MKALILLAALMMLPIFCALGEGGANPSSGGQPAAPQPNVFDLPQLQVNYIAMQNQFQLLVQEGRYAEAEQLCRNIIKTYPYDIPATYRLSCILAIQKKYDDALKVLEQAVALGFNDAEQIKKEETLKPLRERKEFIELLKKAPSAKQDPSKTWNYQVEQTEVKDGIALVTEKNTTYDFNLGVFRVFFKFPQPMPNLPVASEKCEVGALLKKWYAEKTASGNYGDLYDNHDNDHSNMSFLDYPQISRVEFGDTPKARGVSMGLQLGIFYNAPTIGNSSMAVLNTPTWRSMPRLALTSDKPQILFLQYTGNHLYFYPEHNDHDPGQNGLNGGGYGDLLPANTPYYIISQGSSGTDLPFMNAVCATMAAFRPEVKQELIKTGMLMPAIQMIFRMSNRNVKTPEDYLSGKAHPSVFEGGQVDISKMVNMAHEMEASVLPPIALLNVVEEDQSLAGRDYFGLPGKEILLNSPCAIGRVARSVKYTRRMVVSAAGSKDIKGKQLSYHWVVLRGDPEKIKIKKRNMAGSEAEILVSYHWRRPVEPGSALESNRVDIGVFVKNSKYYSPPSFISILYLDNEKRTYDDKGRILSMDYNDPVIGKNYTDPALNLRKKWRDEYHYGTDGKMTGWTRVKGDGAREEFDQEGARLVKNGEKVEKKPADYLIRPGADGMMELEGKNQ